ncbi:MAG TPA: 4Fe-4S double cluster binding domain-containing protein [Candidatus Sulfobium mesophilum]|nr:4Fe-4S double cluster binding domain-containing protein [Candidatus Sulfobium mesophilum]
MNADPLKRLLRAEGATLVGVGDVTKALSKEIIHLNRGIAIAVTGSLRRETVELLIRLQGLTEGWLRAKGHRSLSIPPDSDRRQDKLITKLYKLFCHKTAATCSGLGWVGKNGLIINEQFGSKMTWATVLTDAPLGPDRPYVKSLCGDCDLCVTHCPSGAVKGHLWSLGNPLREIVSYDKCRALKSGRTSLKEKPNCGFCVTVCPYSRNSARRNSKSSNFVKPAVS